MQAMVIVNNSICALLGFPYPEKMARSIPAFEYDKSPDLHSGGKSAVINMDVY
jgi:hypothetical protein